MNRVYKVLEFLFLGFLLFLQVPSADCATYGSLDLYSLNANGNPTLNSQFGKGGNSKATASLHDIVAYFPNGYTLYPSAVSNDVTSVYYTWTVPNGTTEVYQSTLPPYAISAPLPGNSVSNPLLSPFVDPGNVSIAAYPTNGTSYTAYFYQLDVSTPLTTKPVTSHLITSGSPTTHAVTSKSITSSPLTTNAITSAPLTTSPVTSSPVTSKAITSAPITSAPMTTAPFTSRAVTSTVLTSSSVTSSNPPSITSSVTSSPSYVTSSPSSSSVTSSIVATSGLQGTSGVSSSTASVVTGDSGNNDSGSTSKKKNNNTLIIAVVVAVGGAALIAAIIIIIVVVVKKKRNASGTAMELNAWNSSNTKNPDEEFF